MVNKIISAITTKLHNEFGENYEIYKDNVTQGLKEPCFFISCINPKTTHYMGSKYKRTHQFCIQYLDKKATNAEKYEALDKMNDIALFLTVDDMVHRGTNIDSNIDDETVSFFVNYNTAFYKLDDTDEMESLILE